MFSRVCKQRFCLNIAGRTGDTILTENITTAVRTEKNGFKKSQKLGLLVVNYRFYVCLYKTEIHLILGVPKLFQFALSK